MNGFKRILPLFVLLISQTVHASPSLTDDIRTRVYGATFEVVVKKITKDSLSYEKKLPMHLIPFQVRNDKYWSIGTAFAIGPNTFASAAHVFDLASESLFTDFYLRDGKGKVYKMGKVQKFINNKDMIVFSLKSHKVKNYLTLNGKPELNIKVFAVGNALGEGIIIRDGLYTSNTPEERDGKWSWIRFSAAASPGNSGGPLLDEKGQVLGIVLRKSKNENLNYALPIAELISAKNNIALIDTRMKYSLSNLQVEKISDFKQEFKLPLSFKKLNKKLVNAYSSFGEKLMKQTLAENRSNIFPHKNSEDMLLRTYNATFPHIIWKKEDGNFAPFKPDEIHSAKLDHNGYLEYGKLGDTMIYRIKKPDNQPLKKFLANGKQNMDYLLKAITYDRSVGGQKVRVTSLGKPVRTESFTDKYDRKWLIRRWVIEYDDSAVVTMTLPRPDGSATLMRSAGLSAINSHLADLKAIADYTYVSYYGTLKQWDDYLALNAKQLPSVMRKISMKYRPGKRFSFGSNEIMMTFDTKVQKITDTSDLKLYFSFFKRKGKVVWDVSSISVGESKNTHNGFHVVRYTRPAENMADTHKTRWQRLVQQDFPYNKVSYFKGKGTHIGTVYMNNKGSKKLVNKPVLYSVFHSIEGKKEDAEVKKTIDTFIHGLNIPNS